MDRLSERLREVIYENIGPLNSIEEEAIKRSLARFAAYEDTGLEPEEVTGILNLVKFYQSKLSPVEAQEFGTLKEAEQKRRKRWHSADTPPDQDGLYWGKKDSTNSMWAVRYSAGVWSLSAYPGTKMPITEWAYWDAFEEEDSHDGD